MLKDHQSIEVSMTELESYQLLSDSDLHVFMMEHTLGPYIRSMYTGKAALCKKDVFIYHLRGPRDPGNYSHDDYRHYKWSTAKKCILYFLL